MPLASAQAADHADSREVTEYEEKAQRTPPLIVRKQHAEKRSFPPIVQLQVIEQPIIREEVVVPHVVEVRRVERPVIEERIVQRRRMAHVVVEKGIRLFLPGGGP